MSHKAPNGMDGVTGLPPKAHTLSPVAQSIHHVSMDAGAACLPAPGCHAIGNGKLSRGKNKKEALRVFLMPSIAHWPLGSHVDLLFIIIHGQLYVLGTLLCCRPSPINEFRLLATRSDCQPPQPSWENNGAGLAGHTM